MYADDLILLSIFIYELQILVDTCLLTFEELKLEINVKKSACIRIGPRHNISAQPITTKLIPMAWKSKILYLGVNIISSNKPKVNLQPAKQKFFGALNGVFGKVGTKTSPHLLISLVKTFCFPIILYGLVGVTLNKTIGTTLNSTLFAASGKIFSTYNKSILLQCLFYLYTLPLDMQIDLNKLKWYLKADNLCNFHLSTLICKLGTEEQTKIELKYFILASDNIFMKKQFFLQFL